jgi:hypothetical protein
MPRSKTTESRNTFTGVRKLSKKIIKKGNKENNTTTEEMLDILDSDTNYKGMKQPAQQPMQQPMQQPLDDIDPLMVSNFVPTNEQGQINNLNKIGELLGMSQIGNPVLLTDSTIQNPMTEQYNPLAQQLMNQQMPQQMPQQMNQQMPQQMNQQMAPQMTPQMTQFMGQPMSQDSFIDNIKNLSGLYKIPKLA